METTEKILDQLWHKLIPLRQMKEDKYQVFTGFDGFIDKIQKAVVREEASKDLYFKSVGQFTDHLDKMKNTGGHVEIVTTRKKIGGNAPILSNTLGTLGIQTYCLGAMGYPNIHPVFMKLHKLCEVISVINPGENQVIEFKDAKIIFSEQGVFDKYDWEYLKSHTEVFGQLKSVVANSKLFALVDWVNLPHAASIWKGFLEEMIKPSGKTDALFFFHLGDPYKMSRKKVGDSIGLINEFADYGNVTVSMNENEAAKLWLVLNGFEAAHDVSEAKLPELREVARFIFRVFDIHSVIVRTPDIAWVASEENVQGILGRRVKSPKLLMGSGDNFDAGYCLGLLEKMKPRECALLGVAASGAYIQNGYSPCIEDLIEYVKSWADEKNEVGNSTLKVK